MTLFPLQIQSLRLPSSPSHLVIDNSPGLAKEAASLCKNGRRHCLRSIGRPTDHLSPRPLPPTSHIRRFNLTSKTTTGTASQISFPPVLLLIFRILSFGRLLLSILALSLLPHPYRSLSHLIGPKPPCQLSHSSLTFIYPQPTCSDSDLDQFLTPACSASPSTSVEVSDNDNVNSNTAMGVYSTVTMAPTMSVTPITLPSAQPSPPLVPGLASKPRRQMSPASPADQDLLVKRHRNNIAAKKYRQKKVDRIKELEDEVSDIKRERDELRIRLARQEAETAALREMLAGKIGRPADGSGR